MHSGPHKTPSGAYREQIESLRSEIRRLREGPPKDGDNPDLSIRTKLEEMNSLMDARVRWWLEITYSAVSKKAPMVAAPEEWPETQGIHPALADLLFSLASSLPETPTGNCIDFMLQKLDAQSRTWDDDQPCLLLTALRDAHVPGRGWDFY